MHLFVSKLFQCIDSDMTHIERPISTVAELIEMRILLQIQAISKCGVMGDIFNFTIDLTRK